MSSPSELKRLHSGSQLDVHGFAHVLPSSDNIDGSMSRSPGTCNARRIRFDLECSRTHQQFSFFTATLPPQGAKRLFYYMTKQVEDKCWYKIVA
jgi:hypothetical protein